MLSLWCGSKSREEAITIAQKANVDRYETLIAGRNDATLALSTIAGGLAGVLASPFKTAARLCENFVDAYDSTPGSAGDSSSLLGRTAELALAGGLFFGGSALLGHAPNAAIIAAGGAVAVAHIPVLLTAARQGMRDALCSGARWGAEVAAGTADIASAIRAEIFSNPAA